MRRCWWLEQRTQDFPTHQRVNRHPAAQIEIERITLRQHDQRANMLSGQVEDRVGDLRQGFPLQRTAAPPYKIEETQTLQDLTEFWLKHNDEDEPDHGPERLKEPARENQATPARQERYPADDGEPHSREDGAAPTHPEGALVKQIRYQQDVKHALPVEVAYIAEDVIHALVLPSRLSSPISNEEPFLLHTCYGAVEGLHGLGDELRRMGRRHETCHAHQIDAIKEHPLAQVFGDRGALEQGGCVFLEVTEIQSRQARRLLADEG